MTLFNRSVRIAKQSKIGRMVNNWSNFWTNLIFLNPVVKRPKLKVLKVFSMANSVATTWQNSIFHSQWTRISILSGHKLNSSPDRSQNCLSLLTNRLLTLLLLHFPHRLILREILDSNLRIILNSIVKIYLSLN